MTPIETSQKVIAYRAAVFALAAFYSVDRALAETWTMADFGWSSAI